MVNISHQKSHVVQRVTVISRRKQSTIGKNPFMHRGKKYTVNHGAETYPGGT